MHIQLITYKQDHFCHHDNKKKDGFLNTCLFMKKICNGYFLHNNFLQQNKKDEYLTRTIWIVRLLLQVTCGGGSGSGVI